MLSQVKKIIHGLSCNNLTGAIIQGVFGDKIPDLRWPGFKFKVPASSVNKKMTAAVFWGFYESSEIRYVEKYLREDLDVIELGSSLGIVSSHIASRLGKGRHLTAVEANPFLVETITENIKRHQHPSSTFEVLNYAVGYDTDEVMITITSNNTETRVIKNGGDGGTVAVKAMSFADLVKRNRHANYALVCDIEGSELEIILREQAALQQCSQLFIELHDTSSDSRQYSVQQLKDLLVDLHGFKIIQQHGPVVYFGRS
jgi:FkbM family methyltransferase